MQITTISDPRRPRSRAPLNGCWLTLIVFTGIYLVRGNFEFLVYTTTLAAYIGLIHATDRRMQYPVTVKWLLTVWLLLHMLGGMVYLDGVRLYDYVPVPLIGAPYHILRYDQIMHVLSYYVIAGFLITLVGRSADANASGWLLKLLAVFGALGVGALNEIIELGAVAFFGATGVGDYYNNALDHVFNLVGALIAIGVYPLPGRSVVSMS